MSREVKFYWWKSYKIWKVNGATIEEIVKKASNMSEKYHAIHFEVL